MFISPHKKATSKPAYTRWPDDLSNFCNNSLCMMINKPQPIEGIHNCSGYVNNRHCTGTYIVTTPMAKAAEEWWETEPGELERRRQDEMVTAMMRSDGRGTGTSMWVDGFVHHVQGRCASLNKRTRAEMEVHRDEERRKCRDCKRGCGDCLTDASEVQIGSSRNAQVCRAVRQTQILSPRPLKTAFAWTDRPSR